VRFLATAILVFALTPTLSSQSFELVKTFPIGTGSGELGVSNPNSSDQDPTSPEGLVWSRGNWWILDNVNKRLSLYDHNWTILKALDLGDPYHFNVLPLNKGLVLWNGYGYMRTLGGVSWIPIPYTKVQPINLSLSQFTHLDQEYTFLFQYKDVLIFQNLAKSAHSESASYFGIRGLATEKDEPQTYLDDKQVRELLSDPTNTRYRFEGDALFDHDQIVSVDAKGLAQYFGQWSDPVWTHGYINGPIALANGCYFALNNPYAIAICDEHGGPLVVKRLLIDPPDTITYSNLTPAPDGYLYQLRGDWANKETRLYRIGPFPEIKLDYHGTGGTVNDDHVNLRESPTTRSAVVTQVDKGTPTRVLDKTTKPETIAGQTAVWYQVRLWDRTEGWVFGALLDVQK